MQFNTPVNESDMLTILRQIYGYYRVRHDEIEENELEELDVERWEFTPLTDEQLTAKAITLTAVAKQREKEERKAKIDERIAVLKESMKSAEENAVILKEKAELSYEKAKAETTADLKEAGLIKSSVATERLAQLKKDENDDIKNIEKEKLEKIAAALAEIKGLTLKKGKIDDIVDAVYQKAVAQKVLELKDEQQKLEMEVFKYNNALNEKEQRYHNDIQYRGTLFNLRKAELLAKEYAKEELVNMGYYTDVITCVRAYYDTLTPRNAYESFKNNTEIPAFLDDFYGQVLYYYERNYLSTQS